MEYSYIFVSLLLLGIFAFLLGRARAHSLQKTPARQSGTGAALPRYFGYYTAVKASTPGLLLFFIWLIFGPGLLEGYLLDTLPHQLTCCDAATRGLLLNKIKLASLYPESLDITPEILKASQKLNQWHANVQWLLFFVVFTLNLLSLKLTLSSLKSTTPARYAFETILYWLLAASSAVAVLTTIGIFFTLFYESLLFFQEVNIADFLFGTHWSPQTPLRQDQVAAQGAFGMLPLLAGTFLISFIALLVAAPIGLMSSIYLTQYASAKFRSVAKPVLEILAGIPTVVYGFFAAIYLAPLLHRITVGTGLGIESESALAAGIVMGIMIIPFISSLIDDTLTAIPASLKEASLALGATSSETILQTLLPSALPGIISAFLLAFSRAIGETMIVVMAAGLRPNLTANPFESVTTITVQIVSLLTGDQEFDSAKTLAAFALGMVLFVLTLALNMVALKLMRRKLVSYGS